MTTLTQTVEIVWNKYPECKPPDDTSLLVSFDDDTFDVCSFHISQERDEFGYEYYDVHPLYRKDDDYDDDSYDYSHDGTVDVIAWAIPKGWQE